MARVRRVLLAAPARYGTFSVISVIVVLAILVGLNYVAGRQFKRWDLTSNQQFTLSEQTTKILKGLKEPLTMIAFERSRRMAPFRDRLQDYARRVDAGKTDYIDPDKEPLVARKYEIPAYGTVPSSTRAASSASRARASRI